MPTVVDLLKYLVHNANNVADVGILSCPQHTCLQLQMGNWAIYWDEVHAEFTE